MADVHGKRRVRGVLPALSAVLFAGCTIETERAGFAALVTSQSETAASSVVLVRHGPFGGVCSGVMVAPRVVLTAKHCVQPANADVPFDAASLLVTGSEADSAIAHDPFADGGAAFAYVVSAVRTTPGAWFESPSGPLGALSGVDIAVLTLDRAFNARPAPLSFGLGPLTVGEAVRVVAMGRSIDSAPGVRRAIDAHVVRVDGATVTTDGSACDGDSGGALFDGAGRVRAVLSSSSDPCGADGIEFVSVDILQREIDEALAETGAAPEAHDGGSDAHDDAPPPMVRAGGGCDACRSRRGDRGFGVALVAATLVGIRERRRRASRALTR